MFLVALIDVYTFFGAIVPFQMYQLVHPQVGARLQIGVSVVVSDLGEAYGKVSVHWKSVLAKIAGSFNNQCY